MSGWDDLHDLFFAVLYVLFMVWALLVAIGVAAIPSDRLIATGSLAAFSLLAQGLIDR